MKTCYQCPDRYVGCHAQCQPYIDQKKFIDDCTAKINAERNKYKDADEFTSCIINKQRRKSRI